MLVLSFEPQKETNYKYMNMDKLIFLNGEKKLNWRRLSKYHDRQYGQL